MFVFFFKQNTSYEMRISDWSSDVCSSDLRRGWRFGRIGTRGGRGRWQRCHFDGGFAFRALGERLPERDQIVLADLADRAHRQITDHERSVAHATQPRYFEPPMLHHAHHLPALPIDQVKLYQPIGQGTANHIGIDRAQVEPDALYALDKHLKLPPPSPPIT